MTELKQVIVMRKDLGMRKGKMIAQGAHAVADAIVQADRRGVAPLWRGDTYPRIVVGVSGEGPLVAIFEEACRADLCAYLVMDAGHTELEPGTKTCCAIGPGSSSV